MKYRSNKKIYYVFVIIALLTITIGYAVMNRELTITGNSEVKKNTWDVHFENIQVKNGSVDEINAPTIDSDKDSVSFSFDLKIPGDYYVFTVDVVNSGSIDGMVDSITKIPELTEAQEKYLNYIIKYENGEEITSKQLVPVGDFVRVKVLVEYKKDITKEDLPTTQETMNLGFTINYVQSDGTSSDVFDNGVSPLRVVSGTGINIGDEVCIDEECFYVIGTDGDNVNMLAKYNLYVGGVFDGNNWTAYGDEVTGLQRSDMIGWISDDKPRIGVSSYSNVSSDYQSSLIKTYAENYANYIVSSGITGVTGRVITLDEVVKLGCDIEKKSCITAPSWVSATSYWLMDSYDVDNVWRVNTAHHLTHSNYVYWHGVRPVISVSKFLVLGNGKTIIKPIADGSLDDIGTIVTIGDQQFYTIGTEGDNVKLLSMYNLYVGGVYDGATWTAYGNEATGKQHPDMNGYVSSQTARYGTTAFSDTDNTYAGSIVEGYVNNYKTILERDYGVEVEEARLITKDELDSEQIGCLSNDRTCDEAPSWIYSTSYWSGTDYSSHELWSVYSDAFFGYDIFDDDGFFGVRPVIVMSKEQIVAS